MSPQDVDDLVLASSEAATNAVRHSGSSTIIVRWRASRQRATVVVEDGGIFTEPWRTPARPSNPLRPGGHGLSLISAGTDEFDIRKGVQGSPGTRVTLVKWIRHPELTPGLIRRLAAATRPNATTARVGWALAGAAVALIAVLALKAAEPLPGIGSTRSSPQAAAPANLTEAGSRLTGAPAAQLAAETPMTPRSPWARRALPAAPGLSRPQGHPGRGPGCGPNGKGRGSRGRDAGKGCPGPPHPGPHPKPRPKPGNTDRRPSG